jgi:hypothetical protein
MSKRQIIILLGVLIIILPFLGLPDSWKTILFILIGLLLILLAYTVKVKAPEIPKENVPFVEHKENESVKEISGRESASGVSFTDIKN